MISKIKLIELYSDIESLLCEGLCNILIEQNTDILCEMLSDLDSHIKNKIDTVTDVKSKNDMNRSIEQLVLIKKGMRNNDYNLISESLMNAINDVVNTRNKCVSENNIENKFIKTAKLKANNRLTNNINKLKYYIHEEYLYEEQNLLLESDDQNKGPNLDKIKKIFSVKHDKIVARDKKFLEGLKEKTKISADMELEIPDDNNVSFDKVISRYDTFFKSITKNQDINKFTDKNGNLKNGLDNYLRTGSAKKESGTKKVSGDGAIVAVSNMIEYCKGYLNGKSIIINKLDEIMKDNTNDKETKTESYFIFEAEDVFDLTASNNNTSNNKKEKNEEESLSDGQNKQKDNNNDKKQNDDSKEQKEENNNKNNEEKEDKDSTTDINKNKQIGISTLMTIIEQRYFDYIKVLQSLFNNK